MAWALYVVFGKYQVVQDLKDSNESEEVPRSFYVHSVDIGTTVYLTAVDKWRSKEKV